MIISKMRQPHFLYSFIAIIVEINPRSAMSLLFGLGFKSGYSLKIILNLSGYNLMTKIKQHRLVIEQLDTKLRLFKSLQTIKIPAAGWRHAMSMKACPLYSLPA